jgi:hypothetical protein
VRKGTRDIRPAISCVIKGKFLISPPKSVKEDRGGDSEFDLVGMWPTKFFGTAKSVDDVIPPYILVVPF